MEPTFSTVLEELQPGSVPLWIHPGWAERFPWLVQGITGTGEGRAPYDLGLFGAQPAGEAIRRWQGLLARLDLPAAVHAMQVHGGDLAEHEGGWTGLLVVEGVDGHVTRRAGLLLTASVADCVPVAVIDAARRSIALVHAGWRGVAAGIAERAVAMLLDDGSVAADLHAHAGPSICGECYEVGPEVHRGVRPDRRPPESPTPIDLRQAIGERLTAAGLDPSRITISGHCTRCGPGSFFSHRGGSPARQMSLLARRE
jgi:polyphenol oxidase